MADTEQATPGTSGEGPAERMQASMGKAAQTMKVTGEKISQVGSDLGMKLLDQAEANTREAFRAMREAAQARDLADVMRVQSEFMRDQGSRAMTQAREIGELISGFGREAIGSMAGRKD